MFNNAATIITKDFILARVSEEDIFKKYLGLEPTETGSFINPLRGGDSNPGCGFYVDQRGVWKFKDHAAGFNWDCFNVLEYDLGLNFKEALIQIAIDFSLIDGNSSKIVRPIIKRRKPTTEIRIKRRNWTKKDYEFWFQYHITEERLAFFQVFPIQQAWFVNNYILEPIYYYKESDPCFCYHFDGYEYKLYFPLREKGRFLHVNSNILQGYKQLPVEGTNFLYTKSFKDVMCIDVLGREFDLSSSAPMSETVVVSKELHIDIYNRFDNIGTLFDFDRTGITLTRKYEKAYNTQSFFFGKQFRGQVFGKPSLKDFADFMRIYGVDTTRRLIEHFIKIKHTNESYF